MDKQVIIYELTSFCNSNCEDCLRASMNHANYMLKFEEIITALDETKIFSNNFVNFELKLSGGEPTIWKDKNYDILDVMKECTIRDFNYSLVSNGKVFSNINYCNKFFDKMLSLNLNKLTIYITIDSFHKNYNNSLENDILDNLLIFRNKIDLNIYVQSTVTKRKEDNIAINFIEKYSKQGVKFMLNPLLPWGRGKNLEALVPYLDLYNDNKKTLGDYEQYFYILGKSKNVWDTYQEYLNYNNLDAIKRLNCCGKTITFMENKYFYCMPCSDKESFCFAKLGSLNYDQYMTFKEKNKYIQKMKNNDIRAAELIHNCPIGYGVCGLCRNMVGEEDDLK